MEKFLYRKLKASESPSGIFHFVAEWVKTALNSALFLAEGMFHFPIDYRFEKSDILLFALNNCVTTTTTTTTVTTIITVTTTTTATATTTITATTTTTTSLLVLGDPGRLGKLIYIVTVETSRHVEARHTSCMYCRNPETRAGKAHLFM
jgi:hypothetical protein